ncbi:MAG: hypothetical protein WD875_03305 [Pirellulales bacterium]
MAASTMVGPIWGVLMLLTFGVGGTGLPVGIPPAAEDPLLAKIAPEDCMFYLSWAGMAEPDPASKNHTEQLLADAEVQKFVAAVEVAIGAALMHDARDNEQRKVFAAEMPKLVKALLTKPTAGYVGEIGLGPSGPTIEAGLIVSTGEDTAKLMTSVASLENIIGGFTEVETAGQKWKQLQTRPGAPQVLWGFKGRYFIVGVGEGTIEKIVKRARGESPKWLAAILERNKVPRVSSVAYANVKKLTAVPSQLGAPPQVIAAIKALGLANVTHIASVTGLDEQGCLTRSHVAIDGEAEGVFKLLTGKPLTAEDLAPIPADATLAVAMRLDPEQVFRAFEEFVGAIDPRSRERFASGMERMKEDTGIDLSKDVFQAVGDTWRIYNSPSQGGLIATGLTAVASVRDHDRLAKALDTMAERVNLFAEEVQKRIDDGSAIPNMKVTIKHFDQNGNKVYHLNFKNLLGRGGISEIPVSPAWCLTEKELIVSLYPAHVKSYLNRKSDAKRLATVPEVAAALASENPPTMLAYQDTKALFKLAYPVAQVLANLFVGEIQRDGAEIDMSAFPSAGAILPHLQPSISTLSPAKDGIEMTTRQTMPMAFGVWQVLPAVIFTARGNAQRMDLRMEKERFIEPPQGFDDFRFGVVPPGGGFWLPALPAGAGMALPAR